VTAHRPPVAERAALVLRRAGIEPPRAVLAMVSGGGDSTLLVAVLQELGHAVRGLHVAHGLRGASSAADAAFCRALPVPVEVVDGRVEPGANLEARLREARRAAALAAAGGDPVATGHTATDRAETVLYRLATSGGVHALPALPAQAPPFVRPLIDVTRAEVREELGRRGTAWREDPSNEDPAFARNRIRHEVLPVLVALNARADANIARSAELATAERELLAELAAPFLVPGGASLRFREEHVALQREVVRRAAAAAGVAVQHADVEALIGPAGAARRTLPGGVEVIAEGGTLRFRTVAGR
jgi:tRNA(Ile)-lysidine synthase